MTNFSLTEFLPYMLNRAAEESSLEFSKIYKDRYGLLRTEWRVLFHLGQFGEMTATQIGTKSNIHKTKVSRAVAGLQRRRYLRRKLNHTDRRSEFLQLTPAGQTIFAELSRVAQDYNDNLISRFSDQEKQVLMTCLKRLVS